MRGLLDGVVVAMSVMAAALPVFRFRRESGEGRLGGAGGGTTVMTVRGSAGSVEARLAAGRLRSPCCGAVLARWGWARRRVVAMLTGPEEVRPRRGRCRGLAGVRALGVAARLTGSMWVAPGVPVIRFNTRLDAAGVIAPS